MTNQVTNLINQVAADRALIDYEISCCAPASNLLQKSGSLGALCRCGVKHSPT
jgi:hypothetical protein